MFGRVPGDRRREILAVHPEQSVVGRWSSITTMKMMVLSSGEEPRARKEFKLHTQSEEEKNWIRCQQRLPSFFYETLSCLPQADTTLTERSLSPFSSIRNATGLKEKPNTTQKEIRPTSIFLLLLLLPQCPTPSWHANVNKEIVVAVVAAVSFSFSYLPGGLPSSRTLLERRVFVFFLKITAAAIQMHPSRRNRREPQRTSTGGRWWKRDKGTVTGEGGKLFLGCHCLFLPRRKFFTPNFAQLPASNWLLPNPTDERRVSRNKWQS